MHVTRVCFRCFHFIYKIEATRPYTYERQYRTFICCPICKRTNSINYYLVYKLEPVKELPNEPNNN
jgi:hypothetical protein